MSNIYYLFSVKEKCFTDLSLVLQKKAIFNGYYGLAYAKNPIFKNSLYANISYVSDIIRKSGTVDYLFLEKIEKKYNINIADLIHVDRHLLRFDKTKRLFIAQELVRLFLNEMHDFKINMVVVEGVDDFISFFACVFCKLHNIKFIFPTYIGYANRACFSSNIYAGPNDFEEKFQETSHLISLGKIDIAAIDAELNAYIHTRNKPSYSLADDSNYQSLRFDDIKIFFQCLFDYLYDRKGMHYDRFPLLIPFYRLIRILRKSGYIKFLFKNSIDLNKHKEINYLIYPLQLEPESSTLIQGRWLNDQTKIIEMISKNLPANVILIVKEHKVSIGRRALKFYKEITRHHNVFLVSHTVDTFGLIEGSKGVVILSSTMGLEALMLKRPVMAFGERYFNVSKNVYVVENYKKIKEVISHILLHQFDQSDVFALFHTLLSTTKDMGCLASVGYTQDDLDRLAEDIKKEMVIAQG